MLDAGCPLCCPRPDVICKTDYWTVILNDNQATLGRVYFALNRHETDIAALTTAEQLDLFKCLTAAKDALNVLFMPDHTNFVFHMNLVNHVHAHLYPRYKSERDFGGEVFSDVHFGGHYDPHETRNLAADKFSLLLNLIQAALVPRLEALH
jgi:diadenosine tetraphosphate (Ap4A) HIT family hydrolase